jgi:glycosyltransferase involved in cell wall biosynthesis
MDNEPLCSAANVLTLEPSKVAILHDWLTGFRGGEWILEALCEVFPLSPLYTLIYEPGKTSSAIEQRQIYSSFLNSIPGIGRHYRKFLPMFPMATRSLKIDPAIETIISSSHCVIKGVLKPKNAYHLSYVHSPMRYMYDQFDSYFGPASGAPLYQQWGAHAFRPYLTAWDRSSNSNVDMLVANSSFVRERIRRFYQRDAVVVHPFVEMSDFSGTTDVAKEDFFLMVTAFAPNKRVDLAIAAFNELGLRLKIIGAGQENARLRTMAGPGIEFLGGTIDRSGVISHMKRARAFVFPGVEDFGITPLEALAAKTPVIAFRAGGVLETLDEFDSIFFDDPTPDSLCAGVREFLKRERVGDFQFDSSKMARFSRSRFKSEITDLLAAREKL